MRTHSSPGRVLRAIRVVVVAALAGAGVAMGAEAGEGSELFKIRCAMCHGPDGRADTPMGRRMAVKDLTASTLGTEAIGQAIRAGVKGARGTMPEFGSKLSDEAIAALVEYVRALRETPSG